MYYLLPSFEVSIIKRPIYRFFFHIFCPIITKAPLMNAISFIVTTNIGKKADPINDLQSQQYRLDVLNVQITLGGTQRKYVVHTYIVQ